MVRAGALSYVIVVSLLIASILGSLISLSYFNQRAIIDVNIQNRLVGNAVSGFNLLLASPEVVDSEIDLYEDEKDSVHLVTYPWGIFEVGIVTAHKGRKKFSKMGLLGYPPQENSEEALYLADKNRPLSLAGSTIIRGNAYIPEAGVKRAYIERQNFSGAQLINGRQMRSGRSLPELNEVQLANIHQCFNYQGNMEEFDGDSLVQTFDKPTLHIYQEGVLEGHYRGNIIIHANRPLLISSDCVLEGIQVYAPMIDIEEGFKGYGQFFATEHITVHEKVTLEYPSSIMVIADQNLKETGIDLKTSSILNGLALITGNKKGTHLPKLLLHPMSLVHGEVYVQGLAELHGRIYGNIYADKFYLKTPSSIYENHLLNVEIDFFKRNKAYVGSNILTKNTSRKVMQWLN